LEALFVNAFPLSWPLEGRRVALLVVDGVDAAAVRALQAALAEEAAQPRLVGLRLGRVRAADGSALEVETTVELMPSVLWDAAVLPEGEGVMDALRDDGALADFVRDQYRHAKPLLALGGTGRQLLQSMRLPPAAAGAADSGLLLAEGSVDAAAVARRFVAAIAQHRHFAREKPIAE